tara:strand:+ start:131 stop:385 length:255 start_codon:yes stop_codon:yes gene_type:complete
MAVTKETARITFDALTQNKQEDVLERLKEFVSDFIHLREDFKQLAVDHGLQHDICLPSYLESISDVLYDIENFQMMLDAKREIK